MCLHTHMEWLIIYFMCKVQLVKVGTLVFSAILYQNVGFNLTRLLAFGMEFFRLYTSCAKFCSAVGTLDFRSNFVPKSLIWSHWISFFWNGVLQISQETRSLLKVEMCLKFEWLLPWWWSSGSERAFRWCVQSLLFVCKSQGSCFFRQLKFELWALISQMLSPRIVEFDSGFLSDSWDLPLWNWWLVFVWIWGAYICIFKSS
jgi:hypothetical protein